jgi:hypothetical protein
MLEYFYFLSYSTHRELASSFGWQNGLFCCSHEHVFMDISTLSHCIHWPSSHECWAVMNLRFSHFHVHWFKFWMIFLSYLCIFSHVHGACCMCSSLILWIPIFGLIFVSTLNGVFHDLNSVLNLNLFPTDIVNLSLIPHGFMVVPLFLLWFPG